MDNNTQPLEVKLDASLLADASLAMLAEYIDGIKEGDDEGNLRYGIFLPNIIKTDYMNYPGLLSTAQANWIMGEQWQGDDWLAAIPLELAGLAQLCSIFELTREDAEILTLLAGIAMSETVRELCVSLTLGVTEMPWVIRLGGLLNILCYRNLRWREKFAERFRMDKPLSANRLILWAADSTYMNQERREVFIADAVLDYLRTAGGERVGLSETLFAFCQRHDQKLELDDLLLPEEKKEELQRSYDRKPIHIFLKGDKGTKKAKVAAALANNIGRGLMSVEISHLLRISLSSLRETLTDIRREFLLHNDCIYLRYSEHPEYLEQSRIELLRDYLGKLDIFCGVANNFPAWFYEVFEEAVEVEITLPNVDFRIDLWKKSLRGTRHPQVQASIEQIARRYALSEEQIAQAALEATRSAKMHGRKFVNLQDLDNACRRFFSHKLLDFAELVPTLLYPRERLILEPDVDEKFNTIVQYLNKNHIIFDEWGFNSLYPNDTGLCMLFYGPPGTGKTMAACVIGNIFSMDLFRIDVSRIMNRYVGETEKNLARIFDEAEKGRVILLFDEADSLFSKRTAVKSSVDKYANTEVTYLLQRMEAHRGIVVLTTNEEKNLDDAFKRRLGFRLHFGKPQADTRAAIFRASLPSSAPVRPDIHFELLGKSFELSGGNIKKAVLRAAFYAANENEYIGTKHIVRACLEELKEDERLTNEYVSLEMERAIHREEMKPMKLS
ncbi:MAG: ATP-binding protein [Bradymonadia bacterium]|jgi:AAA+ superfamily predicted ATPase